MSPLLTFTVNCEHLKIKNNLCVRFPYMQCNNNSHKATYMNTQKQSIKISFYLLSAARDTGLNISFYLLLLYENSAWCFLLFFISVVFAAESGEY